MTKLPLILSVLLYLLIFWVRSVQGGWEIQVNLFSPLRADLVQQVHSLIPGPQADLVSGIVLGDKQSINGQLRLALRDTSTLHIVVVSGQHLAILAGLFLGLAGLIKRKWAILASLIVIILYTLLTGAQIPVLRAAVMSTLSLLAAFFGRQYFGLLTLIATAAIFLLINPAWLTDLSFQLSFLATLGVVVVSPILFKWLRFLPDFLNQDLSVTMGAQLLVTPVIANNFHQLSLVSVLANLMVGWTVPFIMILGGLMLILNSIWEVLGGTIAFLLNILLTYFYLVIKFLAGLPFAWQYVPSYNLLFWIGYYILLAGVVKLIYDLKRD